MNSFTLFSISAFFSFGGTLALIPLLIRISHKNRWYDETDSRKIHSGNIPRIGGIGLFIAAILGILFFYILFSAGDGPRSVISGKKLLPLIIGVFLIIVAGVIDDFSNLRPRYKLLTQILAAVVVVIGGFSFQRLAIPELQIDLELGPFGQLITLFWIVGMCNAVNLIDGIDGLAGGVSAIASLFFALIGYATGNITAAIIGISLFGSILGFLVFNFPPAKIFMGDTGSQFLGFTIAVLPLLLNFSEPGLPWLFAGITITLIPIFDTLAAILRRIRKKRPIHNPDSDHMHHKLLAFGVKTRVILFLSYTLSLFFGISVLLWILPDFPWAIGMVIASWLICTFFFIVLDYKNKKRTGEIS